MTSLTAYPAPVLDASAREFVATFMANVATVAGAGNTSLATVARIETLLLDALADGAGDSTRAWGALYRTVDEVVATGRHANHTRRARAYLQSFISENGDLTHA